MKKPMLVSGATVLGVSLLVSVIGSAQTLQPRIIGGKPTTIEDHPWMAALVSTGVNAKDGQFCGGSLIAPEWVLTAAHCVEIFSADDVEVLLGSADLADESVGERIGVLAVIMHPGFTTTQMEPADDPMDEPGIQQPPAPGQLPDDQPGDEPASESDQQPGADASDDATDARPGQEPADMPGDTAGEDSSVVSDEEPSEDQPTGEDGNLDDIALLRLKRPTDRTFIAAASADQRNAFPGGTPAVVTGWGNRSTEGEDFPTVLHEASVTVFDDAACDAVYGQSLTEKYICAADLGERDSCSGDSGGPLFTLLDGQPLQIGLVSFGLECGSETHPGAYSRVSRYESFIKEAMNATLIADRVRNFGDAIVGQPNQAIVNYTNISESASIVVSNVRLLSGEGIVVENDSCSVASTEPGMSCSITLGWTAEAPGNLFDTLIVDSFDGANTTVLETPLTGVALMPAEFGETLDAADIPFYIDGAVTWTTTDSNAVAGGTSLQTTELNDIEADTVIVGSFPGPGTVSYSFRGSNVASGVFVDGLFVSEYEIGDEWQTYSVTLDTAAKVSWRFFSIDESPLAQFDAVTFEAGANVPNDPGQTPAGVTDAAGGTGAGAGDDDSGSGAALYLLVIGVLSMALRRRAFGDSHAS